MPVEQHLKIFYLQPYHEGTSIADIVSAMDDLPKHAIAKAPWVDYQYKPDCAFAIAHGNSNIYIKFFVVEDAVLARFTTPNSLVYKDSCVEFFIAFNNEQSYYNLEFNCLGTAYVGYGSGKTQREAAPVPIVERIKSSCLLRSADGKFKWELTLVIPTDTFYRHSSPQLLQLDAKCNFYKCGDDMPVPHYLCWNNIVSDAPEFHLPDFFAKASFIPQS
ncbi:carbohydrate-binding family 9-like protein [Mucilaginibacter sp. PAMB04168]|uniref:carbohydrate-binding family 9-like protein n=1 Tax=Mucilaginibacter sp. PAMB04168 TaxID=3138567 RepID=UPI0031F656B2